MADMMFFLPMINCTFFLDYLLSASIGDNRDAFHAGYKPAIPLIRNERSQTVNRSVAGNTGVICG
jgi:hypothetical protein